LDFFIEKYKRLAAADEDKSSINNIFFNRLIKHSGNSSKSILIYSGRWSNFSALSFSQSLLTTTKHSIFTLNFAHPFTTVANVNEMNPLFSSNLGESNYSAKYFFPSPVCLGEEGFDDEIHFGFAHNFMHFLLCKVKLNDKSAKNSLQMFYPFTHVEFKHYSVPEIKETGSEIGDQEFALAFFPKSSKNADTISQTGLFHRKVLDLARAWNVFDVYQLYSPHSSITQDMVNKIFEIKSDKASLDILCSCFCHSSLVDTPCLPTNRFRVIKLGSIKNIASPHSRAVALAILQRLGLVDQVFLLRTFFSRFVYVKTSLMLPS
jgi:hypothetical protein